MTLIAPAPLEPAAPPVFARAPARVDIVVPVYNEQEVLEDSIRRLHAYCSANLEHDWRIVIADNASTDATLRLARGLVGERRRRARLHGRRPLD
jgi:glycosyltransferase involved in cell wall biosynthesis